MKRHIVWLFVMVAAVLALALVAPAGDLRGALVGVLAGLGALYVVLVLQIAAWLIQGRRLNASSLAFVAILVLVPLLPALALASTGLDIDVELPEAIVVLLNLFMPVIIEIFNKNVKTRTAKFVLAQFFAVGTGVVAAVIAGFSLGNFIQFSMAAFTLSQSAHHLFWRRVWEEQKLEAARQNF